MLMKKEEGQAIRFYFENFILFGIFFIIAIIFFASLNIVNPPLLDETGKVILSREGKDNFNLGIVEILISIAFAFLTTGFLLWIKSIMRKNEYLGAIIGALITFVFGYAFSLRYRGYYSTGFIIVVGAVVFVYLCMNFFRYKNIRSNKAMKEIGC